MLKCMGQSEYGLYSLVASLIAYLSVLDLGFGNAMVRYTSKADDEKEKSKINGLFLFLYIIIGAVAFLIGLIIVFNVNKIFAASLTSTEIEKSKILLYRASANVLVNGVTILDLHDCHLDSIANALSHASQIYFLYHSIFHFQKYLSK